MAVLNIIDDSNLTGNRSIGTLYNDISNPHSTPNSFNIFVLDGDILSSDGLTPGFGPQTGTLTFVSYIGLTSKRILSHEVGHNFYLYHDFRNYGDATSCEHATRDFQNSFNTYDYNADWAGDRIHDTPATKIWNISEYTTECSTYQGGDIDCNQERPLNDPLRLYKNAYPTLTNFMHWHDGNDLACNYSFTPGQGKRIRWAISLDTQFNYGIFTPTEIDKSLLYQPFETTEVGGDNIVSITDNRDGTATVCRSIVRRDRFQKGFDCVYYAMNNNVIDTSAPDDLKVISERTFDYKVKINQMNPIATEIVPVVCTRGVICNTEPYVSGVILSMQVLGSMNITVKELNEAQVNDPELFDKLMAEYYHIIKKQTASGAVDEKIIYKP